MSRDSPSKIKINKIDLFTYFLQKNYWPKITFEEFEEICKSKGIEILKEGGKNNEDKT